MLERLTVFGIAFATGVFCFVYQSIWVRLLTSIFGRSQYSDSIAIGSLLVGIGVGNKLGSVLFNRGKRVWLTLALAVFSSSLVALLSSYVLNDQVPQVFAFLFAGTFATLIGATLSLLIGLDLKTAPYTIGVYAMGGAMGVLLATAYLVPTYGYDWALTLTGLIQTASGLGIWILSRNLETDTRAKQEEKKRPIFETPGWWWIAAGGFIALGLGIVCFRIGVLLWGMTFQTVGIVVSVCILSFGIGSGLLGLVQRKPESQNAVVVLSLFWLGIGIWAMIPLCMEGPIIVSRWTMLLRGNPALFSVRLTVQWATLLMAVFLPFSALGAVFSSAISQVPKRFDQVSAFAIAGSIMGILVMSFLGLPIFGIKWSLFALGITSTVLGSVVWFQSNDRNRLYGRGLRGTVLVSALFFSVALMSKWNRLSMTAGTYLDRPSEESVSVPDRETLARQFESRLQGAKSLFYQDGPLATISVESRGEFRDLRIQGRSIGTLSTDVVTQMLTAHLPFILNPDAKRAAVFGVGTGLTIASALKHKHIVQLEIIEPNPAMKDAAIAFAPINKKAFDDARLRWFTKDETAFFRETGNEIGKYDVFISYAARPLHGETGSKDHREYFQNVKRGLAQNGLLVHWVDAFEMDEKLVQTTLRTIGSVFDHVTIWNTTTGDYLVIASSHPFQPASEKARSAFLDPDVKNDLNFLGIHHFESLLGFQAFDHDGAKILMGSLDGEIYEKRFPKHIQINFGRGNGSTQWSAVLQGDRRPRLLDHPQMLLTRALSEHPTSVTIAKEMAFLASRYWERKAPIGIEWAWLEQWIALDPNNAEPWSRKGALAEKKGDYAESRRSFLTASRLNPNNWENHWHAAQTAFLEIKSQSSLTTSLELKPIFAELNKALELAPPRFKSRVMLSQARAHREKQDWEPMIERFEAAIDALRLNPGATSFRDSLFTEAIQVAQSLQRPALEEKWRSQYNKMTELE